MNGWIALTLDKPEFSHSLAQYEYVCDLIEEKIEVSDDETRPDIVLTSPPKAHSIAVECKSQKLSEDQLRRYKKLEQNPDLLAEESNTRSPLNVVQHSVEVCYSSRSNLSSRTLLQQTDTAFVHFEHTSSGVLIRNPIEFESGFVASAFPINMDKNEKIPTEYYPFDIEHREDNEQFAATIIQALLHTAVSEQTLDTEEVMKEAHPHWEKISEEKQTRFIDDANKVMRKLESENLKEFIKNVADSDSDEWRIHPRTAQAIQDRMDEEDFVERVAKALDNSSLRDSAN